MVKCAYPKGAWWRVAHFGSWAGRRLYHHRVCMASATPDLCSYTLGAELMPVLITPIHERMARLSWLIETVAHPSTNHARRRTVTLTIETGALYRYTPNSHHPVPARNWRYTGLFCRLLQNVQQWGRVGS